MQGVPKGTPCDPPPFDFAAELLDNKIADICGKVQATQPPTIFLTGSYNFREEIAKKRVYKGNRVDVMKPFHYANIKAYLLSKYDCVVADGMEADDAMCIEQMAYKFDPPTIICSRDKDLKMCPGWHYSWENGKQAEWGPFFVEGFGEIALNEKKALKGWGDIWFYAQLLMGDPTDNIPGIPGLGAAGAFKRLAQVSTTQEAEEAVVEAYRGFYGDSWYEEMLEQGRLIWMVRELDQEGKPVMWNLQWGKMDSGEVQQLCEECSEGSVKEVAPEV